MHYKPTQPHYQLFGEATCIQRPSDLMQCARGFKGNITLLQRPLLKKKTPVNNARLLRKTNFKQRPLVNKNRFMFSKYLIIMCKVHVHAYKLHAF